MRQGRHSKPPDVEFAPEVSDLGRGSMIRFGKQRFCISDTALLGNILVEFRRPDEGGDWEIVLSVNGFELMGEWGEL